MMTGPSLGAYQTRWRFERGRQLGPRPLLQHSVSVRASVLDFSKQLLSICRLGRVFHIL